jgi:hypothetical protein
MAGEGREFLCSTPPWKQVIDNDLRSRPNERLVTEMDVTKYAFNHMLELGRPNYIRLAWSRTRMGQFDDTSDPCTTLAHGPIIILGPGDPHGGQ